MRTRAAFFRLRGARQAGEPTSRYLETLGDASWTLRHVCMPQRRTVTFSIVLKIRFSTTRPKRITVSRPGEDIRDQKLILLLEDVPAESARSGTDAEHQFGGDQRAPRECPADFEPGENARESGGQQNADHVARLREAVVLSDHFQRRADRAKSGMHVERDGPEHRMNQDEDHAAIAQPEPDERERQKRDRGQRIEHRGEGFEKIGADAAGAGESGEQARRAASPTT